MHATGNELVMTWALGGVTAINNSALGPCAYKLATSLVPIHTLCTLEKLVAACCSMHSHCLFKPWALQSGMCYNA